MKIPTLSNQDTLPLTLFVALALHSLVILGITFDYEDEEISAPARTLEITVVRHPRKAKEPEKADFLAQTSQEGGGALDKTAKPKTRLAPPSVKPEQQSSQESQASGSPQPKNIKHQIVSSKAAPKKKANKKKKRTKPRPRSSMADLLAMRSQEIQRLTGELDVKMEAYAKRPRRKFVSAATQEYKYASYLQAWKEKVERIGTLNFPDEAKRKKLYGNLILLVSLKRDGSIDQISLRQSSGHKILDDAAIDIVRLAAPFAPFPKNIAKEIDIMDITRTWRFVSGNRLFTK